MQLLVASIFVLLTIPLASADESHKYYWAFVDSPMGFGDKVRFYYNEMMIADAIGRTAVLPPFQITITDYSFLANVDLEAKGFAAISDILDHQKRSEQLPASSHFISCDAWFNMTELQSRSEVPVVTLDQWHTATNGNVDVMLVSDKSMGCIPSWEYQCKEERVKQDTVLQRADKSLQVATLQCDSTIGQNIDQETYEPSKNLANAWISTLKEYPDATTLGQDGICLSFELPVQKRLVDRRIRSSFVFSESVKDTVTAFLSRNNIRRYIAVHWRRSDVLIDHSRYFLRHTPDAVVAELEQASLEGIDTIVLLTDNFLSKELRKFKSLVTSRLGKRVVRFGADEDLILRKVPTSEQANYVIYDIALGSMAEYFAYTAGGSFYSAFIIEQRQNMGKVAISHFQLNMPWHTEL